MRVGPGTSNDPGLERRKKDYRTWEQTPQPAEAALRLLLDRMEAAGFPHDGCDECRDLRIARDNARAALAHGDSDE